MNPPGRWGNRITVAEAAVLLLLARFLVRNVRLGLWRASLGEFTAADDAGRPLDGEVPEAARRLARCVERAAMRLPGTSKCLPKAMALQWLLRRCGIPSRLVVAISPRADPQDGDQHHAWTEVGGHMLVGQCERGDYHPLMVFAQGEHTARARKG